MIPRAALACTKPTRADKRSRKAERSTPQGLTNDDEVGVQSVDGASYSMRALRAHPGGFV